MPAPTDSKALVQARVEQLAAEILAVSHRLHADPELGWQEVRSVELLTGHLEALGFSVEHGVAGLPTAFVATKGSGPHTVGLVAEYDALPGLGHACGHNVIAAATVGAAAALAPDVDALGLTLQVIGTPAEEGGGGKVFMLDAGVFDDLDLAMMIHPGPVDSVMARPRAVAHFDVEYTGKAAHAGAYPHLGVNAADAFTLAQVAIGLLRQQLPDSVRVHGIVTEAGTAPNAIPDHAKGSWYVRAASLAELEEVFSRVSSCFAAGALATGCDWTLRETSPRYAEFRNDVPLVNLFTANAAALGRDMDPDELLPGGMNTASTDLGNVSQRIRAIHPYLGIGSLPAVNHQAEFAAASVTAEADRAVLDGAILLAQTIVDAVSTD
ncbi:M20 family metallopeptidase [Cryobacterium sp.]|uniref:M20 family metallopeptidase n=1 Tax=Cryobacterium sp. TaxID=1926290 RepID=UPI0026066C4B|nr:M20 family metallopeptidase [Cryobacterium sp.]MCU1444494.1 amidohydrolase [Cryobacterium sp.]